MKKKVCILGAGITGLSLGAYLSKNGYDVTILEKEPVIGGMAGSFQHNGYTLDFGPHKIYSQIPGIIEEFHNITGKNNMLKIKKKTSLRLLGKYFDFPVRIFQVILGINPLKSVVLGAGFGATKIKNLFSKKKIVTYEDYFIAGFGRPGYDLLFKDYAVKVWGDPKKLSEELGRKRIPVPNIIDLIFSSSGKDSEGRELNADYFYYPKNHGFAFVIESLNKKILAKKGEVITNATISRIESSNGKISGITYTVDGEKNVKNTITPDFVVSTIYLKDLISVMTPRPPSNVKAAADGLKYRAILIIYLFVDKPRVMKDNFIFFPEKRYIFNRVSELNSFSPNVTKKGKSILITEITCDYDGALYNSDDAYLFRRVMDDLEDVGIVKEGEVSGFHVKKGERIYPIFDLEMRKRLARIFDHLDKYDNMIMLGRQGLYNYNNTDHCIDMSMKASAYIDFYFKNPRKDSIAEWNNIRHKHFDNYRIVD